MVLAQLVQQVATVVSVVEVLEHLVLVQMVLLAMEYFIFSTNRKQCDRMELL
jgi:hypothetical protein